MGKVTSVRAYANNEVAYIAWDIDGKIDGCLGFEVTAIQRRADIQTRDAKDIRRLIAAARARIAVMEA